MPKNTIPGYSEEHYVQVVQERANLVEKRFHEGTTTEEEQKIKSLTEEKNRLEALQDAHFKALQPSMYENHTKVMIETVTLLNDLGLSCGILKKKVRDRIENQ